MNRPALIFFISLLMFAGEAAAQHRSSGEMRPADEVHIKQETGHYQLNKPTAPIVAPAAKTAPEGATAPQSAGPTNPATCDPKNATSPSCYTATQQGHR